MIDVALKVFRKGEQGLFQVFGHVLSSITHIPFDSLLVIY